MSDSTIGLQTSKRKFYKLLDNLSSSRVQLPAQSGANASTTTPSASSTEPPSKRRFLSTRNRAGTAPSSPARPTTAGAREKPRSSIFSSRSRPKSAVAGGEQDAMQETQRKPPNYTPWSHDAFLTRLKTFADVRTWTPKPAAIGEVEWAKRGWSVASKDTVACKGGCEKRLVVKIEQKENRVLEDEDEDDWWTGDLESEMVNRYRGLIVDAHSVECLWRKKGCEDDVYKIKMADPAVWQSELRNRYLSLLAVESSLPAQLDVRLEGMEEGATAFDTEEISGKIPTDLLRQPTTTPTEDNAITDHINHTALALAITGWSGQSQANVHLAHCTKCFQRIGLWLYKDKSSPEDLKFNPIDQHREHCPWKNPITQASTGRLEGMAGWEVLVTLIKGYRNPESAVNESRSPAKKSFSRPNSVYTEGEYDDDNEIGETRESLDKGDKERRSRLQKLKRAFTVKKGNTLSKTNGTGKEVS